MIVPPLIVPLLIGASLSRPLCSVQ